MTKLLRTYVYIVVQQILDEGNENRLLRRFVMEGSIIRFRNVAAAAVIRDGGNEKETLGRLSEPGFSQDQDWRQNQVLRIKNFQFHLYA